MKEALYYERQEDGKVHCLLCPQDCVIAEGKKGFCQVRVNIDGTLYSEIYNRAMAAGMDPIEKKPLYHFHPGSMIYSLGTRGCNQRCDFCQNWHMLQPDAHTGEITAEEAVKEAVIRGSQGIAYTYNEPTIWYEFVLECSQLARQEGLTNVIRHSGAGQAFVNLVRMGEKILVSVEDNGAGFNIQGPYNNEKEVRGLGLLIMEERAVQLGGRFFIETRPRGGTHIRAEIPL